MKPTKHMRLITNFFKDTNGHVVIWQWPNVPLAGWFVCKLLALILKDGKVHTGFESLGMALIFVWAYLEITSGKSYFRRALGAAIMIILVLGYFK